MSWRPSRFHPILATALAAGTAAALCYTLAPAGLPTLDIDGQPVAYSGWLAATFAMATIALTLAACSSWMLWAASATVPARDTAAPMLWRCAACAAAGVLAVGPVIAAVRAWLVGDWIPVGPV